MIQSCSSLVCKALYFYLKDLHLSLVVQAATQKRARIKIQPRLSNLIYYEKQFKDTRSIQERCYNILQKGYIIHRLFNFINAGG